MGTSVRTNMTANMTAKTRMNMKTYVATDVYVNSFAVGVGVLWSHRGPNYAIKQELPYQLYPTPPIPQGMAASHQLLFHR